MMLSLTKYHFRHGGQGQGNCSALLCPCVFFMGHWTPGKVHSCDACGIEFWTPKAQNAPRCNRCTRYKREKAEKLQAVKSFYEGLKRRRGRYNLNLAVINCISREGLSIEETAKVLGHSYETIKFEWEIAKQNAT